MALVHMRVCGGACWFDINLLGGREVVYTAATRRLAHEMQAERALASAQESEAQR